MLQGIFQIALTLLLIIAIAYPLGRYIARLFLGQKTILDPLMNPVESILYKLGGVQAKDDMTGWQYARAILYSNLVMGIIVFLLLNSNPGPGGWAWVVPGGAFASGADSHTTNQRMEIEAATEALYAIDGPVDVFSDSTYVVHCFTKKWYVGWKAKGWKNSKK